MIASSLNSSSRRNKQKYMHKKQTVIFKLFNSQTKQYQVETETR